MKKRFTHLLLLTLAMLCFATSGAWAQVAVTAGSQVTDENDLVSGRAYLLQHGGNGTNKPWIEDAGTFYNCPNSAGNCTQASVWYLIDNGDGTWKIENAYTGKYWPTPTGNANLVGTDAANAGSWALNMSGGVAAPTCNGRRLNRNTPNLVSWNSGSGSVTQVRIFEVTASTLSTASSYSSFSGMDISVSSTEAASISEGQWYVMKNRGRNGYVYENNGSLTHSSTQPSGHATNVANYLVRFLDAGSSKYYLQNGWGNYFGAIPQNTAVPTTALGTEKYTSGKINSTDGHFYYTSETNSIVLDCQENGYPVVGWGTTIPSSTGGNNDWALYPVSLVTSLNPTASEVYTINNTNSDRGAMMYAPSQSTQYVWSSGKNSQTFDASNANCQWVIYPTGTDGQYYLYNVGAGKFAIPSSTAGSSSWVFSNDAVAVTFISQSDGTYKIKTATTNTYAAVSNGFAGPIINYNDVGGNFTITKVSGDQSSAVNTAVGKLVDNQTALTAIPDASTDEWYVMRIKTHGTYADKYVYVPESEITYSGTNYPLTFDHGANVRPAIDNTTYYTRIYRIGGAVYWQLPNGKYLYGANNKFPISTFTESTFSMDYTSGIRMWGSSRYAVPYYLGSQYFIGETASAGNAYYDLYPIDLTTAGLQAWQVTINGGSDDTQLTCTRSDVSGVTSVYNNGWFFLPTGVTPADGDFSLTGMISCTVDATNHTITAEFNPELSLLAGNVVVAQGHQTTGKGSTMQPLLRVKATPFSDFQPTRFTISLTGASNVDNVKVYSTTVDQINFAGVSPTLLGTTASPADGTVDIDVTASSVSANATMYYWITADVKAGATEWGSIDASLSSISYTNAYKTANSLEATALDVSSIGNPDGVMRIYKSKSILWTSSMQNTKYYRIPALLKTGTNTLLAFTDDRYASSGDLGGNHKIDVLVKKSTDGGATWGNAVTVAAGDGSSAAGCGYGDAAVAQAANGDIVCLMAAGNTSYPSGMLHIGFTKSTDGGSTWSAVTDLYTNGNLTNPHTLNSTFVSSGHGITQTIANIGRIAFPALGKVGNTTNEYVVYSDDNGATWTYSTNYGYTEADESKLVELNDGKLLMSIRTGGYNSSANRGYNRTTDTSVENWGEQGTWSDLYANGCNSDMIYYSRSINGADHDVLFHTVIKSARSHNGASKRYDLRLYMSFDQGATWQEAFQLQPGWAAYSSMQVLDNGDLAILFEDGSIGNEDKQDCYDISYVVLSNELLAARIEALAPVILDGNTITLKDDRKSFYVAMTSSNYVKGSKSLHPDCQWTLDARGDGTYDLKANDGSYLSPTTETNNGDKQIKTQTSQPATGWTFTASDTEGYFILTNNGETLHMPNTEHNDNVISWTNNSGNTPGCRFLVEEAPSGMFQVSTDAAEYWYNLTTHRDDTDYHIDLGKVGKAIFGNTTAQNDNMSQQWKITRRSGGGFNIVSRQDHSMVNQDVHKEGNSYFGTTDAEPANPLWLNYQPTTGKYTIVNGSFQLHQGNSGYDYRIINYGSGTGTGDAYEFALTTAPTPTDYLTSGWYRIKSHKNAARTNTAQNELAGRYLYNNEVWTKISSAANSPAGFFPLSVQASASQPDDNDATYYIYVNVDGSGNVQLRSSNGHWIGRFGCANYDTPLLQVNGYTAATATANLLSAFDGDGYHFAANGDLLCMVSTYGSENGTTHQDLLGNNYTAAGNVFCVNSYDDASNANERFLLRAIDLTAVGLSSYEVLSYAYPTYDDHGVAKEEPTVHIEDTYQHEAPHVTVTSSDLASDVTDYYLGGTVFVTNASLTESDLSSPDLPPYWYSHEGLSELDAATAPTVKVVPSVTTSPNYIALVNAYVNLVKANAVYAIDPKHTGPGYPKAGHLARPVLAAIGTAAQINAMDLTSFTTNQLRDMINGAEALFAETDIEYPADGKSFMFANSPVDGDYSPESLYGVALLTSLSTLASDADPDNASTPAVSGWGTFVLGPNVTKEKEDDPSDWISTYGNLPDGNGYLDNHYMPLQAFVIGKHIEDEKFAFVNINGDYWAFNNADMSQSYDPAKNYIRVRKLLVGDLASNSLHKTNKQLYGKVYLSGYKSAGVEGVLTVKDELNTTNYTLPMVMDYEAPMFDDVPAGSMSSAFEFVYLSGYPNGDYLSENVKVQKGSDDNYYTTLYLPFPVVLPADATAYVFDADGGPKEGTENRTLTLKAFTGVLPARTGALIVWDNLSATLQHTFVPATNEACYLDGTSVAIDGDNVPNNWLHGSLINAGDRDAIAQKLFGENYDTSNPKIFVFNRSQDPPGFYKPSATLQFKAGKAFLAHNFEDTSGIRAFVFNFGDIFGPATGIEGVSQDANADETPIYDLNGRRMYNTRNLPHGIYIQNGKKIYR